MGNTVALTDKEIIDFMDSNYTGLLGDISRNAKRLIVMNEKKKICSNCSEFDGVDFCTSANTPFETTHSSFGCNEWQRIKE